MMLMLRPRHLLMICFFDKYSSAYLFALKYHSMTPDSCSLLRGR